MTNERSGNDHGRARRGHRGGSLLQAFIRIGGMLALMALFMRCDARDGAWDRTPFLFEGRIGNLDIRGQLRAIGDSVAGWYAYDRTGAPLWLGGHVDAAGQLTLAEYDDEMTGTGTFRGRLDAGGAMSGEWRSADGKRTLPFTARRTAVLQITTLADSAFYTIETTVPRFGAAFAPAAAALDDTLAAMAGAMAGDFRADARTSLTEERETSGDEWTAQPWYLSVEVSVAHATPRLVSLLVTMSAYTGGAHGNTWYRTLLYDMTGAVPRAVPLSALFRVGTAWPQSVSELCIADLRAQEAAWVVSGEMTDALEYLDVATVSRHGLRVYFPPYAAGSYAEGTYYVSIPWKRLSGLVDAEGPAADLLR